MTGDFQRADFEEARFKEPPPPSSEVGRRLRRHELARALQRIAGLNQIHMIGCSRSGTTMIQYSMIAFRDVIIANGETGPDYPPLGSVMRYVKGAGLAARRSVLITKRNYGWMRPGVVDALIDRVRRHRLGILNIVRDPRDVLSSTHVNTGRDRAYVSPEWWLRSIRAADRIVAAAADESRAVTLRYEDFVLAPAYVERKLGVAFGLKLRPGVRNITEVRRNVEQAGYRVAASMVANMNELRDMDARSIGRWRKSGFDLEAQIANREVLGEIRTFMERYGYGE
jgi:hypothetical protein